MQHLVNILGVPNIVAMADSYMWASACKHSGRAAQLGLGKVDPSYVHSIGNKFGSELHAARQRGDNHCLRNDFCTWFSSLDTLGLHAGPTAHCLDTSSMIEAFLNDTKKLTPGGGRCFSHAF